MKEIGETGNSGSDGRKRPMREEKDRPARNRAVGAATNVFWREFGMRPRHRTRDRTGYLGGSLRRAKVAQKFSPCLYWRFDRAVLAACPARQRRLLGDHEAGGIRLTGRHHPAFIHKDCGRNCG